MDAVAQHLIDEWLHYEAKGWHKVATQCYIAAVNYLAYKGAL